MSDLSFFENNIARFNSEARVLAKRLNLVGTIRVAWFLTFLVTFVYFANIRQLEFSLLAFFVFLVGFGLLVILYNKLKFNQDQHNYLVKINEEEICRLSNELAELPEGNDYLDAGHRYAVDLDIFGPNSVFQLINRTSSIPGEGLLARRLTGGSLPTDLPAYQEAVAEMAKQPEFLQEYQALGRHFTSGKEANESFNHWLQSDEELTMVKQRSVLLYVFPALFLIGFVITSVLSITYYTLLPIIAVNLYMLGINHALTTRTVEQTSAAVKLLKTYIQHIRLMKRSSFKAAFTLELQTALYDSEHDAEQDIQYLSRLLDQLQARKNLLHVFINIPLLLDLQWMTRLNDWKQTKRGLLSTWMNSLAEIEVLVSLGGTAYLNPEWSYPAVTTEEYILHGKDFGHPLLLAEKRIGNDFSMHGEGSAVIVTGPNMAGKSTFLRTMALNVVLAQMGGPVCASAMTFSANMKVFTVMRTQDNLSENISSFYAELDRINQLLQEIEKGNKVLYFLDELLKGTNSADRHRGAEALVKQLIALKVAGFVSTHDIELGQLTQQMPAVSNFSFESIITDNQINFDYHIREGVCSSFNASELMRQMGIKL